MTVIVFGVIAAFGLEHIAHLKALAGVAQRQTTAAQQRALGALHEARCGVAVAVPPAVIATASDTASDTATDTATATATASTTDPVTPSTALSKGTPPGLANDPVPASPCAGTAPPSPRSSPTVLRKD